MPPIDRTPDNENIKSSEAKNSFHSKFRNTDYYSVCFNIFSVLIVLIFSWNILKV